MKTPWFPVGGLQSHGIDVLWYYFIVYDAIKHIYKVYYIAKCLKLAKVSVSQIGYGLVELAKWLMKIYLEG